MTMISLGSVGSYYNNPTASGTGSTSAPTQSGVSSSADADSMSIGEIRDLTDQMALAGKLTGVQQLALIGDGLQDLNAANPSNQPSDGIGYSRTDTGTYDFVGMMNSAAEFARASDNSQSASTYQGIANAVQAYEQVSATSTVKVSA